MTKTRKTLRLSLLMAVGLVLVPATHAFAARWKVGSGPSGALKRLAVDGGYCYWDTADSGPNQCRWKKTTISGKSGCYWFRDGSTNQEGCETSTPTGVPAGATTPPDPLATQTFTASRGTLKITPVRTGVADTWAAHVEAILAFTGEKVRFDVTWRNPIGSSAVTVLGVQVTGRDATTKGELRGISGTRTPIYRTGGSTLGEPTPPGGWIPVPPGSLPPTAETCYYAWNAFMQQQMECFAANMSSFWTNAWQLGVISAGVSAAYCLPWAEVGAAGGPEFSAGSYAACIAAKSGPSFATTILGGIFLGVSNNTPAPAICNADEFARIRLSQACGTAFP